MRLVFDKVVVDCITYGLECPCQVFVQFLSKPLQLGNVIAEIEGVYYAEPLLYNLLNGLMPGLEELDLLVASEEQHQVVKVFEVVQLLSLVSQAT